MGRSRSAPTYGFLFVTSLGALPVVRRCSACSFSSVSHGQGHSRCESHGWVTRLPACESSLVPRAKAFDQAVLNEFGVKGQMAQTLFSGNGQAQMDKRIDMVA